MNHVIDHAVKLALAVISLTLFVVVARYAARTTFIWVGDVTSPYAVGAMLGPLASVTLTYNEYLIGAALFSFGGALLVWVAFFSLKKIHVFAGIAAAACIWMLCGFFQVALLLI
jgi:hypothetical protein